MKPIPSPQSLRYIRRLLHSQPVPTSALSARPCSVFLTKTPHSLQSLQKAHRRPFHSTPPLDRIETHVLSDIGEGVKEVQIIQWFVEEGAQIEEWAPLCEVQSDKAAVEITSKFSGTIKKIRFPRDAVVQVGDGMLDIEVEGEGEGEDGETAEQGEDVEEVTEGKKVDEDQEQVAAESGTSERIKEQPEAVSDPKEQPQERGKHASIATPAVRGLLKEHNLQIEDVQGTGKDGRVLKDDVHKHLESGSSTTPPSTSSSTSPKPNLDAKQTETVQKLTPIQSAMFKSMTNSLAIPHFLYTDSVDVTSLSSIRKRLNATRSADAPKYSFLPFIIKAVSLAMNQYPILNARLDTSTDPNKPVLQLRSNHNIGIGMDTPSGLLVPVIKSVNARSISSIAAEIARLAERGHAGKLSNDDLSGGTITVSNIGSIGGEVVAPVIVQGQLAILGIGKVKGVPVFDDAGEVKRAEVVKLSWSADHRVIDGATMARAAEVVNKYLEEVGRMVVDLS